MLSAINLTKKFGDLLVLDDITETINEGERVVIVGPSGGGKSTFLRCLNCLEDPTAGKIMFDGVDLADLKVDINEQREKMGMVFQQFNLFNNMTVKQNITLAPVQIGVKNMRKTKRKNAFVPLYNKWFEMFGQKHNAKIDKRLKCSNHDLKCSILNLNLSFLRGKARKSSRKSAENRMRLTIPNSQSKSSI